MRLRIYQVYSVIVLVIFLATVLPYEITPSQSYEPSTWAGISIALGASILALVGIVTSILTSRENDRRTEICDLLSGLSIKLLEKQEPKDLPGVHHAFQEKIKSLLQQMQPLRYSDGLLGIFSFVFFVFSALAAIFGLPFRSIASSFFLGMALLFGYLLYYVEQCFGIDNLSKIPKPKGVLKLLSLKVDGNLCDFEKKEKDAVFPLLEEPKKMEVEVEYAGDARNGFLDARVQYTNGGFSYVPDRNTYLSDFVFTMGGYRLTLLEGGKFDTGILQLKNQRQRLPFEITIRSEERPKPQPWRFPGMSTENCSPPASFKVDFIEVGLYEDPAFRPRYKRRQVDYVRLRPRRQTKEV